MFAEKSVHTTPKPDVGQKGAAAALMSPGGKLCSWVCMSRAREPVEQVDWDAAGFGQAFVNFL